MLKDEGYDVRKYCSGVIEYEVIVLRLAGSLLQTALSF